MSIQFIDSAHKEFFLQKLSQAEGERKRVDSYFKALIYLCGLTQETRSHFSSIFDWNDWTINFECLSAGWQTGGTARITRLAFNLWNGCGSDDPIGTPISIEYLPDNIFCCNFMEYFFEAVRLRFSELNPLYG